MTSEQLFVLVTVVIMVAILQVSKNQHRIKRVSLDRLNISPDAEQQKPHETEQPFTESESRRRTLSEEVVPAAREMFEAHRVGWENRANNLGDLFEARRDLLRAEIQQIEALVDYHQTLAVLERVVGQRLE